MIEDRIYKEVLESGLLLDHYFLLCNMKHGRKLVDSKRIQGFVNLLAKKGYIDEGKLTEKGLDLVQNCGFSDTITVPTTESIKEETDFGTWVQKVHKACQDKIYTLTTQRQVRVKIEGKVYSFLCNSTDMGKVLYKVVKLYKITDYDKIERTLMRYIDNCASTNRWYPLMQYYIMKNNVSAMVTDLEGFDDDQEDQEFKSTQKFI